MPTKTIGKTKTRLNLRGGPGTDHEVLIVLKQLTELDVLAEQGDWLFVQVDDLEGFVHRNYVVLQTIEIPNSETPDGSETSTPGAIQKLFGKTKTRLNLREGPGTNHPIIRTLAANTPFEVLDQQPNWLHIQLNGETGYVHVNYVTLEIREIVLQPDSDEVEETSTISSEGPTLPGPLEETPLALPENEKLLFDPQAPLLDRLLVDTWNRYGSLLKALSAQLQIDPGTAVGVLAVESGGRGFGPDGRMIIRFENHVFWDYWGKNNPAKFNQHFKFDPNTRWMGHFWREKPQGSNWVQMHVMDQAVEWRVYEFASQLNLSAARMSISMGGPQIMGFNYLVIGFQSVHQMFDAFKAGDRNQIIGLFDFIKGTSAPSKRLEALKNLDFVTFARYYNGTGQAEKYGKLIQTVYDRFHALVAEN